MKFFGVFFILFFLLGCGPAKITTVTPVAGRPSVMLWAWERPESLEFIDLKTTGVAFLAQTIYLDSSGARPELRRQPLDVPPETYLIAVTRIESNKNEKNRPEYSQEQIDKISNAVIRMVDLPNVKEVQIDFDAALSERKFYRRVLTQLRGDLPADIPLSMTALASWCAGDVWLGDMPVVEAVPMVFEMGADSEYIRSFVGSGKDWNEPLCRASYGISLNEPLPAGLRNRGTFYFNAQPWKPSDKKFLP